MSDEGRPLPLVLGLLRWLLGQGHLDPGDLETAIRSAARSSLERSMAEHAPEVFAALVEALGT